MIVSASNDPHDSRANEHLRASRTWGKTTVKRGSIDGYASASGVSNCHLLSMDTPRAVLAHGSICSDDPNHLMPDVRARALAGHSSGKALRKHMPIADYQAAAVSASAASLLFNPPQLAHKPNVRLKERLWSLARTRCSLCFTCHRSGSASVNEIICRCQFSLDDFR